MIRTLPTPRDTLFALTVFFSASPLACSSGPEPPVKGPSVPPAAALPYPSTPWTFAAGDEQSMGLGLGDINGDGFVDVVISNGNDTAEQPVYVYYNDKTGHFPGTPSWKSDELGYHTGLSLGDVDGDGFLDVAVSLGPPAKEPTKGGVVLFYNHGGELEKTPSYRSSPVLTSVGCALGDADGDGDLDLGVSVARTPEGVANRVYIFENIQGRVGAAPFWRSREPVTSTSVLFADVNQDGLLDLVSAGQTLQAFFGETTLPGMGVVISPAPGWISPTSELFPFSIAAGRIGGTTGILAAYSDYGSSSSLLAKPAAPPPEAPDAGCSLTDTSQTRFLGYRPILNTPITQLPFWQTDQTGWGGGQSLVDLDEDGFLDLVAGRWGPSTKGFGAPLTIYLGTPDSLQTSPSWSSDTCTGVEAIAAADLDNARWVTAEETFTFRAPAAVVTLAHRPVARIQQILKNGVAVSPGRVASVPGGDWISFADRLSAADKVVVRYSYSPTPDLVAVNYLSANMIFYRQAARSGDSAPPDAGTQP